MVRFNQSLFDVAIQETGSIEGLVATAIANGKSVTEDLSINETLASVDVVNTEVVSFLKKRKTTIATGAQMFYPPVILIEPVTLAFGTVEVGDTASLSFTISNVGGSALTVTSITFPYATYTADWNSGVIAAGDSQLVTITYAPNSIAAQNGDIVVNSDATSGNDTVSVTGEAKIIGSRFDGVNDHLVMQTTTIANYAKTDTFSIAVEFKLGAGFVNGMLISNYLSTSFAGWYIYLTSTGIQFDFGVNTSQLQRVTASATFLDYNQLVITKNGDGASNINIYLNGTLLTKTIVFNQTITTLNYSASKFLLSALFNTSSASSFFKGCTFYRANFCQRRRESFHKFT